MRIIEKSYKQKIRGILTEDDKERRKREIKDRLAQIEKASVTDYKNQDQFSQHKADFDKKYGAEIERLQAEYKKLNEFAETLNTVLKNL